MQSDPLWQKILFLWMNPIYRVLHADKYNLIVLMLWTSSGIAVHLHHCGAGMLCGTFAIFIWLIKRYLICGPKFEVYRGVRRCDNSYLTPDRYRNAVLVLNEPNSYRNGYAYGEILADEIVHLVRRYMNIARPKCSPEMMIQVRKNMPTKIWNELEGMRDAIDKKYPGKISFDELIMLQMVPELTGLGCTVYGMRDNRRQIIFGRNMDWLPFSSAQYTVEISYAREGYTSLCLPGMVGCVTGVRNNNNYVLAMNVTGGKYYKHFDRMPSMIYNRHLMQTCGTFTRAVQFMSDILPMSAYHLTITDYNTMHCYSYYQNAGETCIRTLGDNPGDKLVVLNCSYPEMSNGRFVSNYRNEACKQNPSSYQSREVITHVIDTLRRCQSVETVHSGICDVSSFYFVADNGYAADML